MSIFSEILGSACTDVGNDVADVGDSGFFVWASIAAVAVIVLACVINCAVYCIKLHRAVEFKDKDV